MRQALSAPRRSVLGFFRGLALPFRGARLVYLEHLDLARYWVFPIAITLGVLIASVAGVLHEARAITAWIWPSSAGASSGDWGWLLDLAHGALALLVDVVLVVLALLATLLVSGIVAAPFNARLAEVLDERLHGVRPLPFGLRTLARDLVRSVVIETTFGMINIVLFVLGITIPAAGPVITVIGLIAWALYFGVAYVDVPQATRGRSIGERARFLAQHFAAMLGFGTGVGLFLVVPLLNLLFMPAAVAGGVLFTAEAEAQAQAEVRDPPG